MSDKMRIDKWLWMVRVFKTRTVANEACNAGKVKIDGVNCKASREIKKNVEIQIRIGQLLKTIQVVDFPKIVYSQVSIGLLHRLDTSRRI